MSCPSNPTVPDRSETVQQRSRTVSTWHGPFKPTVSDRSETVQERSRTIRTMTCPSKPTVPDRSEAGAGTVQNDKNDELPRPFSATLSTAPSRTVYLLSTHPTGGVFDSQEVECVY